MRRHLRLSACAAWLLPALLLLAAPARADDVDEKVVQHDEEAARYYEQKQWPEAIREWEAARQLDPQPRYLFNIGQAYRRMNLHREAVDYFLQYLNEVERPEYARDPKNRVDPTIKIDLESYIAQIRSALDRLGRSDDRERSAPEPAPHLVAEEIVEAEELFEQMVKEYRAGNVAVGNDLARRLEEVYKLRRDPLLLYYFARAFEKIGRRKEALDYYRRYAAADSSDAQLRHQAVSRAAALTPPPPGQRFLWPGLVFGVLGLAGVATGTALYFEAQSNYSQFLDPRIEDEKLALRERGAQLGMGTIISYAAGGGLVALGTVFLGVAIKKGVRQKPADRLGAESALVTSPPLRSVRAGLLPLLGGAGLLIQGRF